MSQSKQRKLSSKLRFKAYSRAAKSPKTRAQLFKYDVAKTERLERLEKKEKQK